jgi:uncharacterized RDD family membrane protein YckC
MENTIEMIQVEPVVKRASFMRRLAACILDQIFVNIIVYPLAFLGGLAFGVMGGRDSGIASLIGMLVALIVMWIYYITIPVKMNGRTFGKKILDIRVQRLDGRKLTTGTMFIREVIGKFISGLILMIGYLIALGDERRALHDRMADTIVVKD